MSQDQFLSEEQIIGMIKVYLDSSIYDYAVMINGDWGCGKTHLMTKVIIPAIDVHEAQKKEQDENYKARRVIYVSLYGIATESDIACQLNLQILGKTEKGQKVTGILTRLVTLGASAINIGLDGIEATIVDYAKKSGFIFVFDDLERCDMSINKVLGYINGFVEHEGIKTIIIANEKEIGKLDIEKNPELKYLVAASPHIDLPKYIKGSLEEDVALACPNQPAPPIPGIDLVKWRASVIFSGNALYKQIKEKMIGITIYYRPDMNKIIPALLERFPRDLRPIVERNMKVIFNLLETYDHYNLRTVQSALQAYQYIFLELSSLDVPVECLDALLVYCVLSSIKQKTGEPMYPWEDEADWGTVSLKNNWFTGVQGFRFIDEFVYETRFNNDNIRSVVERFTKFVERTASSEDDVLRKLFKWRYNSEEELVAAFNGVRDKLRQAGYSFDLYPQILATIANIVICLGFDEKEYLDNIDEIMRSNIAAADRGIRIEYDSQSFDTQEGSDLYRRYLLPLQELISNANQQTDRSAVNDILREADWSNTLSNAIRNDRDSYLIQKQFFVLIDVPLLVNRITSGGNSDILELMRTIGYVYSSGNFYHFFADDLPNLQDFNARLGSLDTSGFDVIMKYNLKRLKEFVEGKIGMLEEHRQK